MGIQTRIKTVSSVYNEFYLFLAKFIHVIFDDFLKTDYTGPTRLCKLKLIKKTIFNENNN